GGRPRYAAAHVHARPTTRLTAPMRWRALRRRSKVGGGRRAHARTPARTQALPCLEARGSIVFGVRDWRQRTARGFRRARRSGCRRSRLTATNRASLSACSSLGLPATNRASYLACSSGRQAAASCSTCSVVALLPASQHTERATCLR